MSKRSALKARIHTLGEIKSILNAMKNLAVIETNKVSRFLGAQNEFANTVTETLSDYRRFFPKWNWNEALSSFGRPGLPMS